MPKSGLTVLALDTTARAGSVALVADGVVVEERAGDPSRTHGERLPGDLLAVLDAHGVPLSTIDLFAVAAGPGSFTGLRIGIATMQGLALVSRRPAVGVSVLEAIAQLASREARAGQSIGAWIDAQRGDVFSACYVVGEGPPFSPAHLIEREAPRVASPAATLDAWSRAGARPSLFAGDGADRYRAAIEGAEPLARISAVPVLAGTVGLIAAASGAAHPAAIQPLYIRRPDAEVGRETKSRAEARQT
jgi:tRNA threonylcarbamoyladenosine biosynthesis protein TsaB